MVELGAKDPWAGKCIKDLQLPRAVLIAAVRRGDDFIVPRGDVMLRPGDRVVICAEALKNKDLDISRQTHIVMIRRRGTMLVPHGSTKLMEGDTVILYGKEKREPRL